MRVVHWYPNLFAGGSVARAVLGLARAQACLGAAVAVAAAEGPQAPPDRGGANLEVVAWRPGWTVRAGGSVLRGMPGTAARRLRAFAPDVVHIHGGLVADHLWVPRVPDAVTVFSPHGAYASEVFRRGRRMAKRIWLVVERRRLLRRAAVFHALSAVEAAQIRRAVAGASIYCVPLGADAPPVPVRAARDPAAPVRLMFVGRLDVSAKGLDILLDAFAGARRRFGEHPSRPRLTLVGPDYQGGLAALRRRAAALGLEHDIEFTGYLAPSELAAVVRDADIIVQLSRHDAFALSVAEALLAGKPVLLSRSVGTGAYADIASLPHVRVVAPEVGAAAGALAEMIPQAGALQELAMRELRRVREFLSWKRIARLHLERYARLRSEARLGRARPAGRAGHAWAPGGDG